MATVNSASFAADLGAQGPGRHGEDDRPDGQGAALAGHHLPRRGRERQRPDRRQHDDEPRHRRAEPRVRHDERGQEVVDRVPGHLVRARRQELQSAGQAGADRRRAHRAAQEHGRRPIQLGHGVRARGHRDAGRRRGLPHQGRRRPAEARGLPDQGGRGPEPAARSSAAPAASSGSSARASRRTSSRPRSSARRSRTPPWTTGSASRTSIMYKAQFAASMDTSGQKDMEGVTGMTMDGTVTMIAFDEPVEVDAAGRREVVQRVHEPAVRRDDGRRQRSDVLSRP